MTIWQNLLHPHNGCVLRRGAAGRRLREVEFVSWIVHITLNGLFEAFSTIRFPLVKLSNMSKNHVQDACLGRGQNLTGTLYRATWSFRQVLIMQQNATEAHAQHALQSIFLTAKPDKVSNIEARFTVSGLSAACNASPDPNARTLAVEGYIQLSNGMICLHDLDRWVPNTEWTHVGGRLVENADYKKYSDSKANTAVYIHQQIHGKPALSKGGRKSKADKVCP